MRRRAIRLLVLALVASGGSLACNRNPAGPKEGPLATGRWTGDGACLSVTDTACNLGVGCGHGQFPRPTIRADGTFDVDGTYRIEVGPISIEPAPPAHFSGVVTGSRLTLQVVPSGSLPLASYSMTATTAGTCPIPCL
ncbi:MAG TPA: hypothetical protein VG222_10975 [Vicinamibacterales bacterium]|nr:hypothetical protein [Vicinamibacterales bacterium]